MPGLRRRRAPSQPAARPAPVSWPLRQLLRDGPARLAPRPLSGGDRVDVAVVVPEGQDGLGGALPKELRAELEPAGVALRLVPEDAAADAATADVVLALGWPVAPAVLTLAGVRARAVLATPEPAPLAELGWTEDVPVIGPRWLGGDLGPAADAAYAPMPVHRREDLVLVHGEEALGLLATAELLERRPDLTVAVSGARDGLALPFPVIGVGSDAEALAHAFSSATVAFAPPPRGWRPAPVAMLACGQAVVSSGPPVAQAALADAIVFVASPADAADAAERFIDDLAFRAERARAGMEMVAGGWQRVAEELAAQLLVL